jgi:hypothetical protein
MAQINNFKCALKQVEPLKKYFSLEYGPNGECRPCRMTGLASLYLANLEKSNETQAAAKLKKIYEGGNLLTIAEEMDNIRLSAKDELRKNLEELDCFVQSYEG